MAQAGKGRQVYVRFHHRIDEALTTASEQTGLKRATLAAFIIETHLKKLQKEQAAAASAQEKPAPKTSRTACLGLSSAAELYALKIGRSVSHAPRATGKPLILTLPPAVESQLRLLAELNEMSVNHLRSAIVATFLIEKGILQ